MNPSIDFINTYFAEERIQALCIGIIGLISILLACTFLWIIKYSFFKGLAIPLLVLGLLQLTVGYIVFARSPKDTMRVQQLIQQGPQKIKTEELPRIEKVIKNFAVYKWIELSLILISVILILAFYSSPQTFWKGLGLGLLLQTSLIFAVDMVSEKRADVYRELLMSANLQLIKH